MKETVFIFLIMMWGDCNENPRTREKLVAVMQLQDQDEQICTEMTPGFFIRLVAMSPINLAPRERWRRKDASWLY